MPRKSVLKEIINLPSIQTIGEVLLEKTGLGKDEKEGVLAMLALAWIEGAHVSLIGPEAISPLLVGSQEVYDITRDKLKNIIRRGLPKAGSKALKAAMSLEEHVIPIMRLEFDDYSYFLKSN